MMDIQQNNQPTQAQSFNNAPFFVRGNEPEKSGWSEATPNRLVGGTKSPTTEKRSIIDTETGEILAELPEPRKFITGVGTKAVITRREWSGEWRIRCQIDTTTGPKPPQQSGPRKTEKLSHRGAKKLEDSAKYVFLERGGYTTFLTLTLDEKARARVATEETTIQKEISRFFDGLAKMYRRGWISQEGERVQTHGDDLDYCWVAECPKNEQGEDNPHVHVLMRWRVPYELFEEWAGKVESLWGQGFAHLEKIKDASAAGAYIQKAASYLTKGEGSDQGKIRGNRYAISKAARAPEWECWGEFEWGLMGAFINDLYDYMTLKHGADFAKRKQYRQALDNCPKSEKFSRKVRAKKLATVRERLNKIPVIVNKYQATFKNTGAFAEFMQWATDKAARDASEWLPDKEQGAYWAGDQRPDCHHISRIKSRIKLGKFRRWWEFNNQWDAMLEFYSQWEPVHQTHEPDPGEWENYALTA